MAILLIAEHDNASLSDQTANALSAASKIGSDVDVLVAGNGAKAAADAASKLSGVRKVLLVESAELENRLAEPLAATIVSLAGGYDTIIAPATTSGLSSAFSRSIRSCLSRGESRSSPQTSVSRAESFVSLKLRIWRAWNGLKSLRGIAPAAIWSSKPPANDGRETSVSITAARSEWWNDL